MKQVQIEALREGGRRRPRPALRLQLHLDAAADTQTAETLQLAQNDLEQRAIAAYLAGCNLQMGDEIGSGQFGRVYRLTNTETSEITNQVIKVFIPGESSRTRTDRGEALASEFESSQIAKTECLYLEGERLERRQRTPTAPLAAVIMPYIDGTSLDRIIKSQSTDERSPSTDERAKQIVLQIAQALQLIHTQGIAHRDIKPDNIIIQGDACVLVDFGIAKKYTPPSEETPKGAHVYMAPERHSSKTYLPQDIGKGDIYSLGVILLQLLGHKPPAAECEFAMEDTITETLSAVEGPFKTALTGMLDPNHETRWSADQVIKHLSSLTLIQA